MVTDRILDQEPEPTAEAIVFAQYLGHLLAKYNQSQRDLARASKIHPVTINRLLNGDNILPTTPTIEQLADGLGCNLAERYNLHSLASPVINKLMVAVRGTLNHWREFSDQPDLAGFGESIEVNLARFVDEGTYNQLTFTGDEQGGETNG